MSRVTQDTGLRSLLERTGLSPSAAELSSSLPLRILPIVPVLQPRARLDAPGLGCYRFARHYSGNHFCFLFLRLLRCFSSAGSLLYRCRSRGGFPHSDIRGSQAICAFPRLFAACHVLPRLQEPRHPLYALCNLLACFTRFSSSIMREYPAWSRFS